MASYLKNSQKTAHASVGERESCSLTWNVKGSEDLLYQRCKWSCRESQALFTVEVCPILLLAYWRIQSSGSGPLTEVAEAPRRDTRSHRSGLCYHLSNWPTDITTRCLLLHTQTHSATFSMESSVFVVFLFCLFLCLLHYQASHS